VLVLAASNVDLDVAVVVVATITSSNARFLLGGNDIIFVPQSFQGTHSSI
jgi:hypothetical protein